MQKVMKAMNMIASVKLRKLVHLQAPLIQFEKNAAQIALDLRQSTDSGEHPILAGNGQSRLVHVFVFTADKGLCGSHNSSVQKALDKLAKETAAEGLSLELTCIGNRGLHFARRKNHSILQSSEINEKVLTLDALSILSKNIVDRFVRGEIRRVCLIYNSFVSTISQDTVTQDILPLESAGTPRKEAQIEGGKREFLDGAAVLLCSYKLQSALIHSRISEQASRMTAMENASNNSQDLINKYITLQNRLRQTTITNELIEIISGKEALKGR
jgi:F-type H+-transporting ATPase subunit gamma